MKLYIGLIVVGVLTSNVFLSRYIGIYPAFFEKEQSKSALKAGGLITAVLTISSAIFYPLNTFLSTSGREYLGTTAIVLITALVSQILWMVAKRFFTDTKKPLTLIVINSAVLSVLLLSPKATLEFFPSVISALAAGLGFCLAIFFFSSVLSKISEQDIPKSFRGLPITIIASAIVAAAFTGFTGIAAALGF